MKKEILCLLSAATLMCAFTGCGGKTDSLISENETSSVFDEEYQRKRSVELQLQYKLGVYCGVKYQDIDVSTTRIDISTMEASEEGKYDCYGYLTISNKYGDKYKGKFTAVAKEDDDGNIEIIDYDLETPSKE